MSDTDQSDTEQPGVVFDYSPPIPQPQAAVAPPLPTPREFMDRLSMSRQGEITAAAMQQPALLLWLLRMTGAREVDPAHPETIAGVQALRDAGVLTEQEAAGLLAPAGEVQT